MPTLTKGQVRTAIQEAIDDAGSQHWSQTNIDILTTIVQDTLMEAVLDTFPWATSVSEAETTSAAGVVQLSALTSGRFYRIQRVTNTSTSAILLPKLYDQQVPQQTYYLLGSDLVTDPVLATTGLTIQYSDLPTRFTDLATDATTLDAVFEGHESALIYLTGAWAMTKGDRESMAQVAALADYAVEAFLTHIARRYPVQVLSRVPMVKRQIMRSVGSTGLGGRQQQ